MFRLPPFPTFKNKTNKQTKAKQTNKQKQNKTTQNKKKSVMSKTNKYLHLGYALVKIGFCESLAAKKN